MEEWRNGGMKEWRKRNTNSRSMTKMIQLTWEQSNKSQDKGRRKEEESESEYLSSGALKQHDQEEKLGRTKVQTEPNLSFTIRSVSEGGGREKNSSAESKDLNDSKPMHQFEKHIWPTRGIGLILHKFKINTHNKIN